MINSNMSPFQGSSITPKLFNFYLNLALRSNPIIKNKIEDNALLAYADDVVIF